MRDTFRSIGDKSEPPPSMSLFHANMNKEVISETNSADDIADAITKSTADMQLANQDEAADNGEHAPSDAPVTALITSGILTRIQV